MKTITQLMNDLQSVTHDPIHVTRHDPLIDEAVPIEGIIDSITTIEAIIPTILYPSTHLAQSLCKPVSDLLNTFKTNQWIKTDSTFMDVSDDSTNAISTIICIITDIIIPVTLHHYETQEKHNSVDEKTTFKIKYLLNQIVYALNQSNDVSSTYSTQLETH
ncbi:hypothetical protein [Paenibacillus donghaensis]|uniref:Uncharacterized protein n=1 Tax=Paenibacillus donghaensis TaxID=414771 RepID=A0A2Z2K921_9BACL|nr:hypothetical protein [Paenibacillus donghaensis]ASA21837.1 hypothetical protein B9T62_14265 [Paenibacillus donghaensis]